MLEKEKAIIKVRCRLCGRTSTIWKSVEGVIDSLRCSDCGAIGTLKQLSRYQRVVTK